jgi:hypothetical protein
MAPRAVARHDATQRGTGGAARHGRRGTARRGTARHGTARHGTARRGDWYEKPVWTAFLNNRRPGARALGGRGLGGLGLGK